MLLAPTTILVWAHSPEHGREVGVECDLVDGGDGAGPTYHATASSGVAYRLSPEDACALLRIVTPALAALSRPSEPRTPRRSRASD